VAWRVYGLAAGQTITLSSLHPNDPLHPGNRYSDLTAFIRSGTRQLYVLVYSFAEGQAFGAVGEDNENNNLYGPVPVMVTGDVLAAHTTPPVVLDQRPGR